MAEELRPCPFCGSTDIACFAEECGDDYDNVPTFRAVVGCRGCHEEGAYNVVNALYVARVPMLVTTNRSYADMAASGDRVDRRIVERCQPVGF